MTLPASAGVIVQIGDVPAQVLRYSPVFVTASVQNTGSEPILIPASEIGDSHFFLEIGHSPDALSVFAPHSGSGGGKSVWIKPGQSWYFRVEVGGAMQNLGKYVLRAGLTSTGECRFPVQSPGDPPAVKTNLSPVYPGYQCWTGSVLSDIFEVEVVEPDGPTDRAALEFIKSDEFPVKCCMENRFHHRILHGFGPLLERFPTSHYTFAGALWHGSISPELAEKILNIQPNHPMAVYLRLEWALGLVETGREADVTSEFVAQLKLKPALEAYLNQVLQEKRRPKLENHLTEGQKQLNRSVGP